MCKSESQATLESSSSSESVEDKIGRVTKLMKEVCDLGGHQTSVSVRRIVQITTELEDIEDNLIRAVDNKVLPKQLEFLRRTHSQDDTLDTDPSIQFFGVEWNNVFAKCFNLGLNVRIWKQRLSAGYVDVSGLACILADIRYAIVSPFLQ